MIRHNIPTAQYKIFTNSQSLEEIYQYIDSLEHNVVVKASGLAAGKGVIVPASKQEGIYLIRRGNAVQLLKHAHS
jgi:phosphoribosylamine--glycine ligase/phosphoribosylformylglycinamidine cyclo-ligase